MSATDNGEVIAVRVLGFLAADSDRLGRFMTLCGLQPGEIRELAQTRSFLKGVLDYILGDESLLMVFCAETNTPPEDIYPAALSLEPGSHEEI